MATTKNKGKIEDVVFSYATDVDALEEENKFLRETIDNLRRELDHFKKPPLLICEIKEVKDDKAVVRLQNGNEFLVNVSSSCPKLKPGDSVLAEQKNLTVVDQIPVSKKFNVERFVIVEKPTTKWEHVGGLKHQEREIKEVIELPLKKPKLFSKVGIQPPKGILLYGPPGTGKTLLAKAVASSTNSTFIEIVASELVQKFIGEGAKLVNEIFQLAREKAPAIIFIDEIDALAATRVDIGTSGEREVQRTFMQLLAEIDGFKNLDNVKIIGCTNREDILDPAITRPGRLDRKIVVGLPDNVARKEIFNIHTSRMKLVKNFNTDKIVKGMNDFSGAEVKSACTEAGYFAIRKNRSIVSEQDFLDAIEKVKEIKQEETEYKEMFR